MRRNRSDMFDPMVRGTYHVMSRCAQGAFLLSKKDKQDQKECRQRVLEILEELAAIYAITVIAAAFLSNHFHLVLVNLPDLVKEWTDREVLIRAQRAYPHKFAAMGIHREPTEEQMKRLLVNHRLIKEMRRRLSDISWMMRMLKQRVAAEQNRKNEKSGHFWDGRFKMVEITSETQLITTLIYLALNQVRAREANTLDTSFWTSVCWQLQAREMELAGDVEGAQQRAGFLAPLSATERSAKPTVKGGRLESRRAMDTGALEMTLDEFVRLANSAYEVAEGKRRRHSRSVKALMQRVDLNDAELALAVSGLI